MHTRAGLSSYACLGGTTNEDFLGRKRGIDTTHMAASGLTPARPSHAGWFRFDAVDDLERRALPEFFDGGSTIKSPESYQQMRNFMVNTYREAPQLHLSVTECRRQIAADVGCVMRVHAFLEHWGLINYSGAIRTPAGAPAPAIPAGSGALPTSDLSLRAPMAAGGGEWSASETLALIDVLDALGPDASWEDAAQQVGRTAEDCVAHFISLPIEEPHALIGEGGGATAGSGAGVGGTADPMLCQLALLARAVRPPRKRPREEAATGEIKDMDTAANAAAEAASAPLHAAARACAAGVMARALELRPGDDPTMTSLLASVVDAQTRIVATKLNHLEELTSLLDREREHLERLRCRHRLAAAAPVEGRDGDGAAGGAAGGGE